jgi:hypothetical protein
MTALSPLVIPRLHRTSVGTAVTLSSHDYIAYWQVLPTGQAASAWRLQPGTFALLRLLYRYLSNGTAPAVRYRTTACFLNSDGPRSLLLMQELVLYILWLIQGSPTPVKAVPVKATPVKVMQVKASPVKATPVKARPVKATPVKATPVKAAPVKASPVKATPVKVNPVKATPVKATPVKATPVNSAPVREEPLPQPEAAHLYPFFDVQTLR